MTNTPTDKEDDTTPVATNDYWWPTNHTNNSNDKTLNNFLHENPDINKQYSSSKNAEKYITAAAKVYASSDEQSRLPWSDCIESVLDKNTDPEYDFGIAMMVKNVYLHDIFMASDKLTVPRMVWRL